jgi:micrococcal nuclease
VGIVAALVVVAAPPVAAQVVNPHLADDGATVILLEEIRDPPAKRQPRVALTQDRTSGVHQLQVGGQGISPPSSVTLSCAGRERALALTRAERGVETVLATFEIPKDVVRTLLDSRACHLVLVGVRIPIPGELLRAAWSRPVPGGAAPPIVVGPILDVVDGDTFRVRIGDRLESVRYLGVDAPESSDVGSGRFIQAKARQANEALVGGKVVRLEFDVQQRDQYGRLLAYVWVGNLMVNAELVRRGYARAMAVPPNVRYQELFGQLQREARDQKRGLWADPVLPTITFGREGAPRDQAAAEESRPGQPPETAMDCPATHPIKGKFTPYADERCIYHMPGGGFYSRTRPERCYATEDEATRDGCRRSKR